MTKYEQLYHEIAAGITDAKKSKMFGALCIKAQNGKAGVMFWKEDMIFKLPAHVEAEALSLKGAKVFSPMDGRAMNGWTHVPNTHSEKWERFANIAMEYVMNIESRKK